MEWISRLKNDRIALVCLGFLTMIFVAGVFAPIIAPNDPLEIHPKEKFAEMSLTFPLGTDHLGRCIFSRLLYGIRTTVFLSCLTMVITIAIGTVFGLIASTFRKKVDAWMMRMCDVFLSFPSEVLVFAIVGMMGPNIVHAMIANVVARFAWYTRMIRSIVLTYREKEYVQFAKASGASTFHIVKKHLIPNALGEIIVLATLNTGSVILTLSALSFLGLGVQAPTPEWGLMLNEAKNVLFVRPEQMLAPGLAILLVVCAFQYLGDFFQRSFNKRR